MNMFSDQQEADLGDVEFESISRELTVIDDEAANSRLRLLGEELIRYLPPNQFRFRFNLIDFPQVNAFSLAGGRVLVSRKLVAMARNDDELAGVLAHEFGHIVTHQMSIAMTQRFRDVLGVTEVGDRADIAEKYHRFLETWRRHPSPDRGESEEQQYEADQVALFAMARAGFSPQAYVDFWDRYQQTHGKAGNWLSDLFETTKPQQRRLREMLKSKAAMPSECARMQPSSSVADFQKWQAQVVNYQLNPGSQSLPGLLFQQALALPLRPDITNLRFSPDGKYLLAQDDGGIHVLSREPMAEIFFIDAPDARPASFAPDSKSVSFYTSLLRAETWDVATRTRSAVHELIMHPACLQSALSPDGTLFACLDVERSLRLHTVADGTAVLVKKNFYVPTIDDFLQLVRSLREEDPDRIVPVAMAFSPDAHYFVSGHRDSIVAYDMMSKRELPLPGSLKHEGCLSLAFVGPDRLACVPAFDANKSPVFRFPTGEKLTDLPLSNVTHLSAAAHGDNVLVWPLVKKPLGIVDVNKRVLFAAFDRGAGDAYDGIALAERLDGEVALTDTSKGEIIASLRLNQSRLGRLNAIDVSDDFGWLAASTKTRGALWDLAHNIRIQHFRGFQGAWFAPDNSLYADFPKQDEQQRAVLRVTPLGSMNVQFTVPETLTRQYGPYLIDEEPRNQNSLPPRDVNIEVHDVQKDNVIWMRFFPQEAPATHWNRDGASVLLSWPADTASARSELDRFPDLRARAEKNDYLLERVPITGNAEMGKMLLKTNNGSFRVESLSADGDWVAASVNGGRVLIYSLISGEEKGHVFGSQAVLSAAAGLYAVTADQGEVSLYDLPSSQLRHHYLCGSPVAFMRFSRDGKRFFVLTRDQSAYIFDLSH
jgi:WD40 repeat protein